MSAMVFGAHVDSIDPVAAATELGIGAAQFFLGDPQGWKGPKVGFPAGADALREVASEAEVALYIHSPYVLNLASTNNRIRIPSRQQLQKQLTMAAEIGASGVIVHGGHVLATEDPEVGFANWRKAIDGLSIDVPLLIENTAGGANAMARTLERIDQLWNAISGSVNADRVGFCLDTCHAHAGGNQLSGLVDRIKAITGRIDLVHGNDSRDAFDSGADRHANLGAGNCDAEGLAEVFASAGAPIILETPGDAEARRADLDWLASAVKQG
ncbi:deoxyribonuclease IV [Propionicimonas sp.]|uniref:deoxyribonuclease IV n=1 Tax=Propionicimonas sp. TaxID=1955623 RepID=UPI0025CCE094|nr:deoxyribonuclease IV [Propionicimonas sp.]MCG2804794.1 deoxyribonuclease IV [Propionicimonas sp.]